MAKVLLTLILFFPLAAISQISIKGRVINQADKKPVANASVFLSNTTIGTETDESGAFSLQNIAPGKYDLVVSIVGFSSFSQQFTVNQSNITLPDIGIATKSIGLHEVKVKATVDADWQRNYDWFKNEFLGTSAIAKNCKIVNPELLDLQYDEKNKTLTGKSVDYLIINNTTLGYRIKYLLTNFVMSNSDENAKTFLYEGNVLFEEMTGTPLQEDQWKKQRLLVYEGSKMQFLRAVVNNRIEQDGFRVLRWPLNTQRPPDSLINARIAMYSTDSKKYGDSLAYWKKKSKLPKYVAKPIPNALSRDEIIEQTKDGELFVLRSNNCALYVLYNKNHKFNSTTLSNLGDKDNNSTTLLAFNQPYIVFDHNGTVANPEAIASAGAWSGRRLAELLPLDYEPLGKGKLAVDSTSIKTITSKLTSYVAYHGLESAYLHFDKPYYATGDTIYFKSYVTAGGQRQFSTLSTVLNVELIGPNNKIAKSEKLLLKDGIAWGDFTLDDTLKPGNYRLRAYTNRMRDAGPEYFFDKNINILSASAVKAKPNKSTAATPVKGKTELPPKAVAEKIDVQFFPEGGNIIYGNACRVGFKAIGQDGLGRDIKGKVVDHNNRLVVSFASSHLGMGAFLLTPLMGERYKAIITHADSSKSAIDLPIATDAGFALKVTNSGDDMLVHIATGSKATPAQLNLIAQSRGIVYYTGIVNPSGKGLKITIPKSQLPTGIIQLTLLTTSGEPLSERLIFNNNDDLLKLGISSPKVTYGARDKVKIDFDARDKEDKPVGGTFSVAITNETEVPVNEATDNRILASMLLTSELKGYIEQPNYYFTKVNDKVTADLDVLMLSQGYHRFEWKQILNDKPASVRFPQEQPGQLAGAITNRSGKTIPYGKVSLMSQGKSFFIADTTADTNGRFVFDRLPVMDSINYIIQAADKNVRKNAAIVVDDPKPPAIPVSHPVSDNVLASTDKISSFIETSNNFHKEQRKQGFGNQGILLKEVQIKRTKVRAKYLTHSSNLNGPGNADQVITADQLPSGCNVFDDCLRSRLQGINFKNGVPYSLRGYPMLVIIDGVDVSSNKGGNVDANARFASPNTLKSDPILRDIIGAINMNDIASIEILRNASSAASYGVRAAGGVMIITTKHGDDDTPYQKAIAPGITSYSPPAYYKARVFYSPKYDVLKPDTHFTDLRTTIYWNPNVVTDSNGKASFDFFNADEKGVYRVVIEGMDAQGNIGRQVYRYVVE